MEDIYKLNNLLSCPEDVVRVGSVNVSSAAAASELHLAPAATGNYLQLEAPDPNVTGSDLSEQVIKAQIANHPRYLDLVSAYIECQKVL